MYDDTRDFLLRKRLRATSASHAPRAGAPVMCVLRWRATRAPWKMSVMVLCDI